MGKYRLIKLPCQRFRTCLTQSFIFQPPYHTVLRADPAPVFSRIQNGYCTVFFQIRHNGTFNTAFYTDFRFFPNGRSLNLTPGCSNFHPIGILIHGKINICILLHKIQCQVHMLSVHPDNYIIRAFIFLCDRIFHSACIYRNNIRTGHIPQDIFIGIPVKPLVQVLLYQFVVHIYMTVPVFCLFLQKLVIQNHSQVFFPLNIIVFIQICTFFTGTVFLNHHAEQRQQNHHCNKNNCCQHRRHSAAAPPPVPPGSSPRPLPVGYPPSPALCIF